MPPRHPSPGQTAEGPEGAPLEQAANAWGLGKRRTTLTVAYDRSPERGRKQGPFSVIIFPFSVIPSPWSVSPLPPVFFLTEFPSSKNFHLIYRYRVYIIHANKKALQTTRQREDAAD